MHLLYDIKSGPYFGADLIDSAWYLLIERADDAPSYCFDMAGCLMLNFLIEAYLNYVLDDVSKAFMWNEKWKGLEKKLSAEEKYFLLKKEISSRLPTLEMKDWPIWATELIKFRNAVVHMKSKDIQLKDHPQSMNETDLSKPELNPPHINYLNKIDTKKLYDDVKTFLDMIKCSCSQINIPVNGCDWPSVYSSESKRVGS